MRTAEVGLLPIATKAIQNIALDTKHALMPISMMLKIMILVTATVLGNNGTIPAATIGDNSCIGRSSCEGYLGPMIGDNACVGRGICANCSLTIEDGQCNENIMGSICNCPLVTEPFIVIQDEEPLGIPPGMDMMMTPPLSY